MALDPDAIGEIYSQLVSAAQQLNVFGQVTQHEPKAAPVSNPALALWFNGFGPARGQSGLDATSARVEFRARVYLNYAGKPEDAVDPKLIELASLLVGAYSGGFTLGGEVMAVDLLGAWGNPLEVTAGWLEHDGHWFRVAELTVPVILDDTWRQVP